MKRSPLVFLTAWLSACLFCMGAGTWNGIAFTAWNGVAITAWNGTGISAAGGGPTYLLTENFDGTGYQNTWTEGGTATPNEDYTTTVLQGTQSWRVNLSAQAGWSTTTLAADQATLEVYFQIRITTLPGTARTFLALTDNADATVLQCLLRTTGNWTVRPTAGGTGANSVTNMATGTLYHVWCRYVQGTGANAVGTIAYSTDGIRPASGNSFISVTTGNATTGARKIILGVKSSDTVDIIADRVLALDSAIGNSP